MLVSIFHGMIDWTDKMISFCFVGVAAIAALTGCAAGRAVSPAPVRDSVYIEKIVPIETEPDSAMITAYLHCTEEGRVITKRLQAEHTKNVQMQFAIDSLNTLKAKVVTIRDTIYTKETVITKGETVTKTEYIEKELGWWQRLKMETGGVSIGIAAALIGLIVFNICTKRWKLI